MDKSFQLFILWRKTTPMFAEYAASLRPHSLFGDKRTNARFPEIIEQLGNNFDLSIPQSANDNPQMQGIYNFFFQPSCKTGVYATC